MRSYERCMCGDPECSSCGPPQGYGPLRDDLEVEPSVEDWIAERRRIADLNLGLLDPPRCDLVVRTENDHWEVGEGRVVK